LLVVPPSKTANRLEEVAVQICRCTKCPLHASRTLAVPGEGSLSAKVMIIGEAPGKDEDRSGRPFVGSAGRYLDHILEGRGIARDELFVTNIVKCRPPQNRLPNKEEVAICTSNYLFEQIALINPQFVVLLGGLAAKSVLGLKNVAEARGRIIEQAGRRYLVTYHPAVRFYRQELADKIKEDFALLAECCRVEQAGAASAAPP
jgi:uracil-DNA glycosylase family 4